MGWDPARRSPDEWVPLEPVHEFEHHRGILDRLTPPSLRTPHPSLYLIQRRAAAPRNQNVDTVQITL